MAKVYKLWGYEDIKIYNKLYCMKYLHLNKGYQSSLHYHKIKDETFIIDSGIVKLEHEDKIHRLKKGETFRIKPNEVHRFTALTPKAVFIEVSTYDSKKDSYRIEKSCKTEGK
jgi:mannose-6-phosphate isomerase-like protein (cupin superfamily)